MWNLAYTVRYSATPINPSLFNHNLVLLSYNNTTQTPFHDVKPSSTLLCIWPAGFMGSFIWTMMYSVNHQVERWHSNICNLPDGINLTRVVGVVFVLMTTHHRTRTRIRNLTHAPFVFTESTNCLPIMYWLAFSNLHVAISDSWSTLHTLDMLLAILWFQGTHLMSVLTTGT